MLNMSGLTSMFKIIVFIFLLSPITALGCSCFSEAKNFEDEIKEYDAIFTGVAIEKEMIPGDWSNLYYKTKMKVMEVWKDKAVTDFVYIKTSTEKDSCGELTPTIRHKFIVFSRITE
ncbi:MAG: hypothetical protein B7X54_08800, partial [Idiomarina sp. 34-48-12]